MFAEMARQRLRKRTWRHYRFLNTRQYFILLTIGCLSSFSVFSVVFYTNADYLVEFLQYMFSSNPGGRRSLSIPNTIENYQPREFVGKSKSVNYDSRIRYNDFDYRKLESLSYKSRTYANGTEILFRLPKIASVSALLLIFHACNHSAYEWFHTPERQRIIGAAMDLGYVCLVFQATDKNSRCWSNVADIYENKDVQMVFKGLEGFYAEYPKLGELKIFFPPNSLFGFSLF